MFVGFISKKNGKTIDFDGVELIVPSPVIDNLHRVEWFWRLVNYKDQTTRLVSMDEYKLSFVAED